MEAVKIFICCLNGFSAFCALVIVLVVLGLKRRDRDIVDRVSLRLQTGIAVVDILKHITFCFSLNGNDSVFCSVVGFLVMLSAHVYMLLNISIALNLHLAIILSKHPRAIWEFGYWLVSLLLPVFLNVPLLMAGIYGKSKGGLCLFRNGPEINDALEMVLSTVPSVLTLVYCLTIAIIVVIKMKREKPGSPPMDVAVDPNQPWDKTYSLFNLNHLISRTCLYPIACFLSCVGPNAAILYFFAFRENQPVLFIWAILGFSSTGILNVAAFFSDPLVYKSLPRLLEKPREYPYNPKAPKFYHFQLSSTCNVNYQYIVLPATSDSPSPNMRNVMIKIFQKYI